MPTVVFWYRIYCLCLAALYLLVALVGGGLIAMVVTDQVNGAEEFNVMVMGVAYGGVGCCFGLLYGLLPFVLPRTQWAWVTHICAIGLTMTSPCCLPFGIPLLIYWFKPETKAYFNIAP